MIEFWRLPDRPSLHRYRDHLRIAQQVVATPVTVADPRGVSTPWKTSVTVDGERLVLCIPCEARHRAQLRDARAAGQELERARTE